jgi:DNA gyrase subunit B
MRVEVLRDGKRYVQEYSRGAPKGPSQQRWRAEANRASTGQGAAARHADLLPARSGDLRGRSTSAGTDRTRLRESAYLNKGLWIRLRDERIDREKNFYFEGGVTSFVRHLNRRATCSTSGRSTSSGWWTAPAWRWRAAVQRRLRRDRARFANNIHTIDGGTHVAGFRAALTGSLNDWARKSSTMSEKEPNLTATTSARA